MSLFNFVRQKVKNQFSDLSKEVRADNIYNLNAIHMRKYTFESKDVGINPNYLINGKRVIVSLTTYSKRLYDVYLTIESIMQQSVKPTKIILWLEDQLKETILPQTLQNLIKRGLEVNFCKDIRSYKKLIFTLAKYPNDLIITVDDDVIYSYDMLENMLNAYKNDPNYIYANKMIRIVLRSEHMIEPYNTWNYIDDTKVTPNDMPIGVGGVLYPPNSLNHEVFNEKVFMGICKYGDDIWFKAMSLMKGFKCKKVTTHEPVYFSNESVQDMALTRLNKIEGKNDTQFHAVFNKYNLYDKLIENE